MPSIRRHNPAPTNAAPTIRTPRIDGRAAASAGCPDRQSAVKGRIRQFMKSSGMKKTQFGKEAVNNQNFMRGLETGAQMKEATMDKIEAYIDNWRASRG